MGKVPYRLVGIVFRVAGSSLVVLEDCVDRVVLECEKLGWRFGPRLISMKFAGI